MTPQAIMYALKRPFNEVHWRVGATTSKKDKGIPLAYIDARDVMQRFDEVMGVNWQVEYPFKGCCKIGLKIDGEWLWRANGAGETAYEAEKGEYSDAFKRAAVLWGVGQYLYGAKMGWKPIEQQGKSYVFSKDTQRLLDSELSKYVNEMFKDKRINKEQMQRVQQDLLSHLANEDKLGIKEVMDELSDSEQFFIFKFFNTNQKNQIKSMLHEANQ